MTIENGSSNCAETVPRIIPISVIASSIRRAPRLSRTSRAAAQAGRSWPWFSPPPPRRSCGRRCATFTNRNTHTDPSGRRTRAGPVGLRSELSGGGKNLRDLNAAHAVVPIIYPLNEGRQRLGMPTSIAATFFTGLHVACLLAREPLDADLRQPRWQMKSHSFRSRRTSSMLFQQLRQRGAARKAANTASQRLGYRRPCFLSATYRP